MQDDESSGDFFCVYGVHKCSTQEELNVLDQPNNDCDYAHICVEI